MNHGSDWDYIYGDNPALLPYSVKATKDEINAIVRITLANYAETHSGIGCQCHPEMDFTGLQPIGIHVCPPHAWLREADHKDGPLRIEKLLWIRRTRQYWMAKEGLLQHCPKCQTIYQVSHLCTGQSETTSNRPGSEENRLPW